jgi:outer membrane protein OmpA-like peptidoglycan-associated protein
MKTHILYTLPLAAALMLPAMAQQASGDSQQPTASSSQNSSQTASSQTQTSDQSSQSPSTQSPSSDQNLSAHQPLEPNYHQGFWGKLNPFARKKYVQNQVSPIRNRVNELDDLTAANAKQIKDVDARAQEGIRQADARATQADQHAIDAGNRAQRANQTALQASNRLHTVEQVVGNIDQYQPATQTEIRFRPGQTVLSAKAKAALDDMTANLKDQKGYIIEVQGFSPTRGQAGIKSSQALANSVVRYLVEKNAVPVYRIFVMGLGNAKLPATEEGTAKPAYGSRVEISLLKNNVNQLGSMNQPAAAGEMGAGTQDSNSGAYPRSKQSAPAQQPANNVNHPNSAPANSTPPPQQ